MILLDQDDYYKVITPLSKVTINNLFANAVVQGSAKGRIFVDTIQNPKTFYIIHPYGMALLFGESNNSKFNQEFKNYSLNVNKKRIKHEWLQVFPNTWDNILLDLFKNDIINSKENINDTHNKIELNSRVNFKFNVNLYKKFKEKNIPKKLDIKSTNKNEYDNMKGSVIPSKFWNNSNEFLEKGVGFSLYHDNNLATTAFSAFITETKLELGMETLPAFRGKGFAQYICSALIDYCIENNYEPIWACRSENIGSYKLAIKLGFEEEKVLPYFRLCK